MWKPVVPAFFYSLKKRNTEKPTEKCFIFYIALLYFISLCLCLVLGLYVNSRRC